MPIALLISHPDVSVDPDTPIERWQLSARGIARMTVFASSPITDGLAAIYCSRETKAVEAAQLLATARGLSPTVRDGLQEMDRSATGFLPPDEFERTANAFFAEPARSVRGWERAVDAQHRIVRAVDDILAAHPRGKLAIVSHGGVGTLLLCACLQVPISRRLDQPSQGHYWAFELATRKVLHGWRSIAADPNVG